MIRQEGIHLINFHKGMKFLNRMDFVKPDYQAELKENNWKDHNPEAEHLQFLQ